MSSPAIKTYPNPILKKKAARIDRVNKAERELFTEMARIMYLQNGIGLAAVQIGIGKQLAVLDIGSGLIKMANPCIVKKKGRIIEEEGCLSLPGIVIKVKRAKNVVVTFLDELNQVTELKADGLLARALQHEIDHLNGILIIDKVNPIKRLLFIKKAKNTCRTLT